MFLISFLLKEEKFIDGTNRRKRKPGFFYLYLGCSYCGLGSLPFLWSSVSTWLGFSCGFFFQLHQQGAKHLSSCGLFLSIAPSNFNLLQGRLSVLLLRRLLPSCFPDYVELESSLSSTYKYNLRIVKKTASIEENLQCKTSTHQF